MTTFGDLPVEIHRLIANSCGDIGHGALTKLSLLNRYFQSLALPMMTSSATLDHLRDDDRKLQLFTHRFAPLHRTKLITLSLVLGRSQIPAAYSLDDGLDEIYANIISLLPLLKTLHVTISSGSDKGALEEGDFSMTLKAMQRLKHLEALTICQDQEDSSSASSTFVTDMLFDHLPRFKCLRKLKLERMDIVLPSNLTAQSDQSIHLTHLHLQSLRILKNPTAHIRGDLFTEFINFFSENIESLNIKDITLDLPSQPCQVVAPRLYNLGLSFSSTRSGDLAHKTNDEDSLEQLYRQVLENFSRSSSLESINICEPVGLAQYKLLHNRGGFRDVFQVNRYQKK
ncbi:hypothetical protein PGTUg99_020091 [Puccinia graminis f. sp. tritici]|uniref:F-box domain-containing protein n=1 Tax=Puccinia graminis f. sp. tritici TaxID=56615 RepID=A0A5B0NGZ5_PUCGR|nr:hypothetical protein PGTUg99_020091 [Puccinia graminis f. sp. tritici]